MAYGFDVHPSNPTSELALREKFKQLDLFNTLLAVPAIAVLSLALQWGGTKYRWNSPIVVIFFVLAGCLMPAFGYLQHRLGDKATLPPRIVKQRSIISGVWYAVCCNGVLSVTEYYLSIYFQGVRGFKAAKSGLLGLPMIIGFSIALVASGMGIIWIGYHFLMFATNILAPIASGLLTAIDFQGCVGKVVALIGYLGVALGLGVQGLQLTVQTFMDTKDVSIAGAVIVFGSGMDSALWICTSATLFHKRFDR
ncbi:hypothetical protein CLAIMM_13260 [Cladophialophora immunda]|nr:hypothetical protein CLAIMM_13260 [Cladophialophora immunda]